MQDASVSSTSQLPSVIGLGPLLKPLTSLPYQAALHVEEKTFRQRTEVIAEKFYRHILEQWAFGQTSMKVTMSAPTGHVPEVSDSVGLG